MVDASFEFDAACYNALGGYCRPAIGCLRNALETVAMGAACEANRATADYNRWRAGGLPTEMNWAAGKLTSHPIETHLKAAANDTLFFQGDKPKGVLPGFIRRVFGDLSDYSHSRPGYGNADLWESNGPIYARDALVLTDRLIRQTYALCFLLVRLARPTFVLPGAAPALFTPPVISEPVFAEACRYLGL